VGVEARRPVETPVSLRLSGSLSIVGGCAPPRSHNDAIAIKGCCALLAYKIVRKVQPAGARLIGFRYPTGPDNHEHVGAGSDAVVQSASKISSRRDVVDIDED
jgi:hypothetical protein